MVKLTRIDPVGLISARHLLKYNRWKTQIIINYVIFTYHQSIVIIRALTQPLILQTLRFILQAECSRGENIFLKNILIYYGIKILITQQRMIIT